jgi:hypothetical protein
LNDPGSDAPVGHGGSAKVVWWVWAAANLVGGLLIALPDTGPRLFSLSRTHGPSALDAIGAVLVLIGWVGLDAFVVARRDRLRATSRTARVSASVGLAAGVAVLLPTISLDLGAWWILGVALLAGVQLWAAVVVSRPV